MKRIMEKEMEQHILVVYRVWLTLCRFGPAAEETAGAPLRLGRLGPLECRVHDLVDWLVLLVFK